MAQILMKPLVDEDEANETTGDEYEDSTKQQDELYVYFDVSYSHRECCTPILVLRRRC